jgi:hypothetical protein
MTTFSIHMILVADLEDGASTVLMGRDAVVEITARCYSHIRLNPLFEIIGPHSSRMLSFENNAYLYFVFLEVHLTTYQHFNLRKRKIRCHWYHTGPLALLFDRTQ